MPASTQYLPPFDVIFLNITTQTMETSIRQPFNAAQVELLKAMAALHTDEDLQELKLAVSRFFAERADREMDRLWDEGVINEQVVEDWKHEHMRTPYRSQSL